MKQLMLAYKNMIGRCHSESHQSFKNYGARGIVVCDIWKKSREAFVDWAISNGFQDGLTLDRINNNGPYSPGNCRWITMKEQQSNRRSNRLIEFNGETKTLTQWAESIGVRWDTLKRRIDVYKMPLPIALKSGSLRKRWEHGSRAGYELHKCRCDVCRKANTDRLRAYRKKHDLIGYAAIAAELSDAGA